MTETPDKDHTLPTVVADLEGRQPNSYLQLTIIFHPDTRRIGETAVLPPGRDGDVVAFGRYGPLFDSLSGGQAAALGDPHVSRLALSLTHDGGSLLLQREVAVCRCQVMGRELDRRLILQPEQLQAGVPVMLAHRVVLLLRRVPKLEQCLEKPVIASDLVGDSDYMQRLRRQIASVAVSGADVLIQGETGTGKELVATALHRNGPRAKNDLVTVNMAAISPALAPAQLFGNARGAFTGAEKSSAGYFEQADGGVLFLDEIGDTPAEVQAQLLRALQQREIQRVGGAVRKVDVRVLAATDANLDRDGAFNSALRHRLGACEIVLRPLREHPEDIGSLLWHFLSQALTEAGSQRALPDGDSHSKEVAAWAELFHRFVAYDWPGNIRQLSNFCRQVALASESGLRLPGHLAEQMQRPAESDPAQSAKAQRGNREVDDVEFLAAMDEGRYEPMAVARLLGMPRTSVYRRIETLPGLRLVNQLADAEIHSALDRCDGSIERAAMSLKVSCSSLQRRMRAAPGSSQQ